MGILMNRKTGTHMLRRLFSKGESPFRIIGDHSSGMENELPEMSEVVGYKGIAM
jgi:hypothetical protein